MPMRANRRAFLATTSMAAVAGALPAGCVARSENVSLQSQTTPVMGDAIIQPGPDSDAATPWGFINPQDAPYNAGGDGIADDTAALQNWANALGDVDGWLPPDKTYRITDTVTIPMGSGRHVRAWAKQIVYDGAHDRPAIVVGGAGDAQRFGDFEISRVTNRRQSDWSNNTCIGVHITDNVSEMRYTIHRIENFTTGLKCTADEGAHFATYGPFRLGLLRNHKRSIWWHASGPSSGPWFNENFMMGPRAIVDDGFPNTTAERYGYYYTNVTPEQGNDVNNSWLGTVFDLHPEDTSGQSVIVYNEQAGWNYSQMYAFSSYGSYDLLARMVANEARPDVGTGWRASWWGLYCDDDWNSEHIEAIRQEGRRPMGDVVQVLDYTEGSPTITGLGGFLF